MLLLLSEEICGRLDRDRGSPAGPWREILSSAEFDSGKRMIGGCLGMTQGDGCRCISLNLLSCRKTTHGGEHQRSRMLEPIYALELTWNASTGKSGKSL